MLARSIITFGLALGLATPTLALAAAPAPDTAAVELVEFASFQCPFSAREVAVVQEVRKKYGNKLTFSYRHLPLAFHVRARPAAIAFEAARRQGKDEAMYEKLFANQKALEDADLRGYAEAVGLDMARYDKDIASAEVAAIVERDAQIAAAIGATGTPTFYVNGKKIAGAQPIDKFTALVDEELAAAGKKTGAKWRAERAAVADANFHKYVILGEAVPEKPVSLEEQTPPPMPPSDAVLEGEAITIDTKGALKTGKGKTEIVIFGAHQCPFTARAVPAYLKIADAHPDKVTLVFKLWPLPHHPMSRPAGEAAVCAEEQKKGWALTSAIFAHQTNELTAETLASWSANAGINKKKLDACIKAGRGAKVVDKDSADAAAASVNGTPTVFVNGKRVSNWTAANVEALILAQ